MKKRFLHTFAICAYKECEYLEDCVKSVLNQSVKSRVIMVTSTDNSFIRNICSRYGISLFVRDGESDISDDWNFACLKADSDFVTVVHQDDVYDKDYLKWVLNYFVRYRDCLFVCTDYYILKDGMKKRGINCWLKEVLRFPLSIDCFNNKRFFKVFSLAFGNSINCPSVTYNCLNIGDGKVFTSDLKFSLDWDTFLKFARRRGRIGYIRKRLVCYRIHKDATTVSFIKDNGRYEEDVFMFSKIWPKVVVKVIMLFYTRASKVYGDVLDE